MTVVGDAIGECSISLSEGISLMGGGVPPLLSLPDV